MIVRNATPADIAHVILNMREECAAEAYASLPHEDPHELAAALQRAAPRAHTMLALADFSAPVALMGLGQFGPGHAAAMMINTPGLPAIGFAFQRWWRRSFVPERMAQFRRVGFTGSLPDSATGRWYRALGFSCEGIARAYGKRGEDFGLWAWINPCWRTVDASAPALGSIDRLTQRGRAHV